MVFGISSAGDDIMEVRMIGQLSSPGVEDTQKSGHLPADIFFIGCQFFHGLGRGLEQGGIAEALMASDKAPERLWHGKGDHEVVSWKLSPHLLDEPLMGFVVLTVGTMPITA